MAIFSTSSGEQTATKQIHAYQCAMSALLVITDGTNNAKVIIRDGGAAGTVKWEQTVIGTNHYGGKDWAFPVKFDTDIHVTVSGTGASYIVEYIERD
jgi:hypothetical protein